LLLSVSSLQKIEGEGVREILRSRYWLNHQTGTEPTYYGEYHRSNKPSLVKLKLAIIMPREQLIMRYLVNEISSISISIDFALTLPIIGFNRYGNFR